MVDVWTTGVSLPRLATRLAQRAEADGFDGMVVVDSQNLAGDCYVALAMAARDTTRLKLGTGVTNPFTRHPAVTASAIASIQAESAGRAVLGIGRGDSSLAHLGLAPAPVKVFERYLERVQAYLRGEEIAFAADDTEDGTPVASLELAATPRSSQLHWLRPDQPKVPVEVAASGPKVIRVAARLADRVMLAVGADPDRVRWGMGLARTVREDVPVGAYVNVVANPDVEAARRLARGGMSTFARFNVMHGTTHGPVDESARAVLDRLHDAYDMRVHTRLDSPQAAELSPEFVDRFGIAGPSAYCVDRLDALVELGLDKLIIVGASLGAGREEMLDASARFVEEVLPALR